MIKVENLGKSLSILSPSLGKPSMPILACVRVRGEDKKLYLSASNMEMQIDTVLDADVKGIDKFCIDASKLNQFAKLSGSSLIEIKHDGDKCALKAKSRATVNALSFDDFPNMKISMDGAVSVTVDAGELSRSLSHVVVSVANQDTRVFLNGLHCSIKGDQLVLTGSDGNRLSQSKLTVTSSHDIECIIPKNTAIAISKTFNVGEIEIILSKNSITIDNGVTKLTGKNIEAKYPCFKKAIDLDRVDIESNKSEFMSNIEAAAMNANPLYRGIAFDLTKNKISMSAGSNGQESSIDMDVEYSGSPVNTAFCATFLTDGIKNFGENINISVCSKNIVITGDNKSDISLIMSMRT
jgi:DNA polymerase-3 subunit beta